MANLNTLLTEARLILEKSKVSRNESRLRGEQFTFMRAALTIMKRSTLQSLQSF